MGAASNLLNMSNEELFRKDLEQSENERNESEVGTSVSVEEANERLAKAAAEHSKTVGSRFFEVQQRLNKDGATQSLIRATKADWISNLVYLDGARFSFKGREYLLPIYNGRYKRKVLKFGRQSEKSTMLANELIANAAIKPYNKALYVSPSHSQTRQFSAGKLSPWMKDSPILSRYWLSTKVADQVFEKGMTNGSLMWLRSAFLNAERIRGITANELMLDELQSMVSSNIPVIMEVLSHSPDPSSIFAGTPLTNDNILETYWQDSSQCEWLVPCFRHDPVHYNFLDEKCLGKHGPICSKCGHTIYPPQGGWVPFSDKRDMMGFHISQLQVPWMQDPEKWKELLWKFENYSQGQFYNEVLGISFDSAAKPVSRTELIACCSSYHPFRPVPDAWTKNCTIFAGVDWGEGSDGTERGVKGKLKNASYTVLTLGTYINPKQFHVFFKKRYYGEEAMPSACVKDIIRTCQAFGVKMIGVDWGHGWGVNEQVEDKFGKNRVIRFQYVGMQKERKKFDPIGIKMQLNRTEVMTDYFDLLKRQQIIYPPWEVMKDFLKDHEAIHAEYTNGVLKYDHKPSEPDDAFHSEVLCKEAADHFFGKA